jgi:hypothetical protein
MGFLKTAGWVAALSIAALVGGCSMAQVTPPKPRPIGEIAREEKGEIVTVRDTRIDLSTGMARSMTTHSPRIPVGPVGVRVPVTLGGEKKTEIPGEEISVRLRDGKMVMIVQELSSPPFAPGERVRVQYEKPDELNGVSRTKVVRDY